MPQILDIEIDTIGKICDQNNAENFKSDLHCQVLSIKSAMYNEFMQSAPHRLLFYSGPLIFLLIGGMSVAIGYIATSAILVLVADHPFQLGNVADLALFCILIATSFAIFTYGMMKTEKSTFSPVLDHIRHVFFFYLFLTVLLFQSYDVLYLAFIDAYSPLTQALVYETLEANLSVTWLSICATIIATNLVFVF